MKVLLLVRDYFPMLSGVPNVMKYLCEGLVERGVDITVATRNNGYPENEFINGVSIRRFNIWDNVFKKPCGDIEQYKNFVFHYPADVVVFTCSQCITTDLILPDLNKIKAKKVFYSHGFSGFKLLNKPFGIKEDFKHTLGVTYNWILSRYYLHKVPKWYKYFDAAICLSEVDSWRPFLERLTKVHVINNAADPVFFANDYKNNQQIGKYVILNSKDYIINVANYNNVKNQQLMLKEYYKSDIKDTALVFIGIHKNKYYKQLVKINDRLKKKYRKMEVHILTGVERNDIAPIVGNASVYLSGSRCEEFSISLIEAMALGVPFISTNVGNAKTLPGGVVVQSPTDLHLEIEHLMKDSHLRFILGEAGKSYAFDNCQTSIAVDKFFNVLNNTISL